MIQVNRIDLARFLDLTILQNDIEFKSAMLIVSKDSIGVRLMLAGKTFLFSGKLAGKGDDAEPYVVGFSNLPDLRQFIDNFPEIINIEKDNNKLKFSGKDLKAKYQLKDTQYMRNELSEEDYKNVSTKIKSYQKIPLTKEQVKLVNAYFKALESRSTGPKEQGMATRKIVLCGKGKRLSVELENKNTENSIETSFELDFSVKEFKIAFPPMVNDIFKTIGDDLVLYIQEGAMCIEFVKDNISFNYFVAPLKVQ